MPDAVAGADGVVPPVPPKVPPPPEIAEGVLGNVPTRGAELEAPLKVLVDALGILGAELAAPCPPKPVRGGPPLEDAG